MLKNVIDQLVNSPNTEHEPLTNFINNEFVKTEHLMASVNPATGRSWIQIPNSGKKDVCEAVAAAKRAFPSYQNSDGLATLESRDQGKPVKLARLIDIPRCVHNFRFFATAILHHTSPSTVIDEPVRAVNYVRNDPVGVAGLISPWNLPLYLLSFKLAPALATGNTVVCKPSELTSVTAWVLMHAFKEAGTAVGKKIAETGARLNKKISLEMGGKNAAIVYPSCDLSKHLTTIAKSCFINQGEICLCSSRIFVHSSVYENFVDELVNEAKKGFFIAPTVVTGLADSSRCMQEEIFGPVVCVTKFTSIEEVTKRANNTCYGLSATVWSENNEELINTAHGLRVGTVWCNTWLVRPTYH
ncbi:unnamed protein product [Strongylus vulgaris]|uniref:Aldehyde dehydrogenase domain-containing protein n=1 Tax=Strongylus vulgaris TaxID=40348 RepID=A0A3P7J5D5_STRVU|nr:unnamed protein product [Strongylus vulgaris]